MNWDVMLLLPLGITLGIMYYELFSTPSMEEEWEEELERREIEKRVALFEKSCDNKSTIRNATINSNQMPSDLHQQTS